MSALSTLDPDVYSAIEEAIGVLLDVAAYRLEGDAQQRMHELLAKKESCTPTERDEHRQLADLWRKRTLQKLKAINALKRLHETAPELIGSLPESLDDL
jgi:hypothetical protein